MLEHGGKLQAAVKQYSIPADRWIDLSTGINPNGWQGEAPPASRWSRLPEDDDGLEAAANQFYNATTVLPVSGSQTAIQALPRIRSKSHVAVLAPSYNEHAHAWQRCGHHVNLISADNMSMAVDSHDVVVIVNPNNPTGHRFSPNQLRQWHAQLAARNGWLVVDEAFMDTTLELSLSPQANTAGLIVLRSLGKFFGLAGARVGFVFSERELLNRLADELGPWTISGPARWLATQALIDKPWQTEMREQLHADSARLKSLLESNHFTIEGGTTLFQSVLTPFAESTHSQLAQQGILTRLFTGQSRLRFGHPANNAQWKRLESALHQIKVSAL